MQTDQGRNHNYQPLNSNILEDRSSNRSINQKFGNLNIGSEHSQANQPLIGQVQDQTSIQSQISGSEHSQANQPLIGQVQGQTSVQSQNQVVNPNGQVEDVQSQGDLQPPVQFMGIQEKEQAIEEINERNKEKLQKLEKKIYKRLKKEFQQKIDEMKGKLKQYEKKKMNYNWRRKKQTSAHFISWQLISSLIDLKQYLIFN
ncbi:hypothetical protein pb186bvf_020098 [Paramecium bursaria]